VRHPGQVPGLPSTVVSIREEDEATEVTDGGAHVGPNLLILTRLAAERDEASTTPVGPQPRTSGWSVAGQAISSSRSRSTRHVLRIWTVPVEPDETRVLGLYRADSRTELDRLLAALRLTTGRRSPLPRSFPPQTIRPQHPIELISSWSRSSGVALSAIASVDARREDEGTGVGLVRLGMRERHDVNRCTYLRRASR
jgi:hypothetical protein